MLIIQFPLNILSASRVLLPGGSTARRASEKKPGKAITYEQTPEGFAPLQRTLLLTHVAPGLVPVVMEATGTGYSLPGFPCQKRKTKKERAELSLFAMTGTNFADR
jgi:hypothetical protein